MAHPRPPEPSRHPTRPTRVRVADLGSGRNPDDDLATLSNLATLSKLARLRITDPTDLIEQYCQLVSPAGTCGTGAGLRIKARHVAMQHVIAAPVARRRHVNLPVPALALCAACARCGYATHNTTIAPIAQPKHGILAPVPAPPLALVSCNIITDVSRADVGPLALQWRRGARLALLRCT